MQIWDNILLALSSLKSNKMRAILTMLGIIIGIGAVIGIVTVGDSLTGSITDSMSSFGINNITVSLTQKSTDTDSEQGGARLLFGPSSPSEEDLISDAMIEEYRTAYGANISAIALTESMGQNTAKNGTETSSVNVTGVNVDVQTSEELAIISGRFLNQEDLDGQKKVCVVSDYLAQEIFGTTRNVVGQTVDITVNNSAVSFYIAGIYEYDEDQTVSLENSTTTTTMYIPITLAKKLNYSNDGY